MANLRDLLKRYKTLTKILVDQRADESLRIATDLTTLVKARVQGDSLDYLGQPFAGYNPIYAEYGRRRNGYQAERVDFNRTGRLWTSVRPVVVSDSLYRTEIEITSTNPEDNTKLQGQFSKGRPPRGNILRPSEKEIEVVRISHRTRIERAFREAGF
jgi:hypothetical protein